MKKKILSGIFVTVFAAAMFLVVYRNNRISESDDSSILYPIQLRMGSERNQSDGLLIKQKSETLFDQIRKQPKNPRPYLQLVSLYLQEARITGKFSYYDMAALKCIRVVLKSDPANYDALTFKAMILLSQHHFEEGLELAKQLVKVNQYNSFVYGLLVDGYVEMGDYKEAVECADKMVSIRPDMRSYSRIAYLREIHGEQEGAIAAMKMAVDAGAPGEEGTEWSRIQLGRLFEQEGNLAAASMEFQTALQNRDNYPYALSGLARLAAARQQFGLAKSFFKQAEGAINDNSFKIELAEIYTVTGMKDSASILYNLIIHSMEASAGDSHKIHITEHNNDMEIAYAYLETGKNDKALEHALQEYNRRPGNIDVNSLLAWVYYRRGEIKTALPFVERALKTNTCQPSIVCRAGLIYAGAGEKEKAKRLLGPLLNKQTIMSPVLEKEARIAWLKLS